MIPVFGNLRGMATSTQYLHTVPQTRWVETARRFLLRCVQKIKTHITPTPTVSAFFLPAIYFDRRTKVDPKPCTRHILKLPIRNVPSMQAGQRHARINFGYRTRVSLLSRFHDSPDGWISRWSKVQRPLSDDVPEHPPDPQSWHIRWAPKISQANVRKRERSSLW